MVTLSLQGINELIEIEFVIDTGFDGEIALPETLIHQLEATVLDTRYVQLAGGFRQRCYSYELILDWNNEVRRVEVLTLDGNPLLGNGLWDGLSLYAENQQGGEVAIESV